jgi:cell pole-organizing protein PopZ
MTDAKNQQAEPSMEEILASIRRIISEDTESAKTAPADAPAAVPAAAAPPAPARAAAPAPVPAAAAPAAEVLELTEMVDDDGKVMNLTNTETKTPPAPPAAPASDESGLISKQAASAAVGALTGLQAAARRDGDDGARSGFVLGNGAATVEDIVRAELRPLLKAWLDANLPPLVERLVQREIKRITRQIDEA